MGNTDICYTNASLGVHFYVVCCASYGDAMKEFESNVIILVEVSVRLMTLVCVVNQNHLHVKRSLTPMYPVDISF